MSASPERRRGRPTHPPWRRGLAVALAATAALGPASAARGEKVEIGEIALAELLDPSVEAVTRREELAADAPAAVFVLSGDDLRRQGFRTVYDALRTVPGLFAYADGLWPSVGVRGVGLLTDYATRVLVLVDGHPMNNSVAIGASYVARDLPVPLAAVRRIEVIKGPVGSVYGPTAFLAVVNVVTRGPDADAAAAAAYGQLAGGAAGGEAEALVARAGERGGFALSASAYATQGQDRTFPELALDAERPVPPGGAVDGLDSAGSWNAYARGALDAFELQGACGGFRRGIASAPYGVVVGDDRTTMETLTCFAQLGWARAFSQATTVAARLAYDDFEYRDAFAYDPPPDSYGIYRDRAYDRWATAELRADFTPTAATRVSIGVTGQHHWTEQEAYSDDLPSLIEDPVNGVGVGPIHKDYWTLNTWLLAEQQLGTLRLHAGLTWYVHEIFGSRLTPKLAAVWRPTASDTMKLVYSEGFRPPTAAEAFYEDGTDFLANPGLAPEEVRSAEAVYERRVGDVALVSASAFWNDYTNLIQFTTVPFPTPGDPGGTRQMGVNAGALAVAGAEASATVRWGALLQAWGGFSFQRALEGDAPNFPEVVATASLSTQWPWRPLTVSLSASYLSSRAKDPTTLAAGQRPEVPQLVVGSVAASLAVPGVRGLAIEASASSLGAASALHPVAGDFAPITEMPEGSPTFRVGVRWSR
jgi:iron complex outermembrane receptor protein